MPLRRNSLSSIKYFSSNDAVTFLRSSIAFFAIKIGKGDIEMASNLTSIQDINDFLNGVCILGTGGGGKLDYGRRFLYPLAESGKLNWVDVDGIGDDDTVACVWYMGSVAPVPPQDQQKMEKLKESCLVRAVRLYEERTGVHVNEVVALEMGASNTAAGLETGALLNLPVLDGDLAGRAVPEIIQVTPFFYGIHLDPFAVCDEWGNEIFVQRAVTGNAAEMIGKMISVVTKSSDSSALCGNCGIIMKGRDAKKVLVRGTLTKAFELGKAISNAKSSGKDPFQAAVDQLHAIPLFQGTIEKIDWESKEGYMYGKNTISGTGKWEGKTCEIWYKNENHMLWVAGKLRCSSPDSICGIYTETGVATNNPTLKEGEKVAYMGIPNPEFRKPEILKYISPKHFGFNEDYYPVESIQE
jgi:DUF917 family protein